MKIINKSKPVLVTGATGYVAGWLVKRLLEEGINVHAAVRNPENEAKRAHLDAVAENAPGNITYFKSDLLEEGSYDEAMKGCEVVFHTASPFTLNVKDAQKDLVDPAVKGTQNVLESANRIESVKRVVVTSSCAAIYSDAIDCQRTPNGVLTEDVWNTTSSLQYQPYSYSKTLAEKKAWEMMKSQSRWDLVTINPSFVMGPPLNPNTKTSESVNFIKQFGDGTMKMGVPKMGVGVVDVRDLAEAHFQAGYTPDAHGRYISSAHNTDFLEMGQTLKEKYGKDYPIPERALPKWLLMLIGPLVDKNLTRDFIRNNANIEWRADNSKIKNELGIKFRPLKETMQDSFQTLVQNGLFKS